MKANELSCRDLMVGDWVRIKITQHNTTVTNIDTNSIYTEAAFPIRYDEIEPILLTPEILEKNGFVPKFSDGCLTEYLIYKDIVDGLHEMYIKIVYFNTEEKEHKLECFDCRTGGCQIWIKYVHQLQQTLRLCGIKKEIEL